MLSALRFRRIFFASTICTGTLSDCEKLKVIERQYYQLVNDRQTLKNIDEAKAHSQQIDTLRKQVFDLKKSCDAAQSAIFDENRQKQDEIARQTLQREQQKADENAPKFFNSLVDMVEADDRDMHNAIMRYVVAHGDDKIILWTSSEHESSVYNRLPNSKYHFSYSELRIMSFGKNYNHTIRNGEFKNWRVYSEPFWKMSIFIVPTREQHIVLKK